MKTAVWLYLFLFVAFFDLHAQYPMLTPFAVSMGAAPSFIGLVMGIYSLTHLPGNLLAGYAVDRFGSRFFIAASLIGAGLLLLLQSRVTDPWQLLYIRSFSGFVLAFLSPACMAMLARLARDLIHQGKLMAGNGLVHTVASVVSPAAGAWLAATIGFSRSFAVLGWVLLATGIASLAFVREPTAKPGAARTPANGHQPEKPHAGALPNTPLAYAHAAGGAPGKKGGSPAAAHVSSGPSYAAASPFPWAIFILPVSLACAQGILSFELPLRELGADSGHSVMTTGLLFSVVSLGALATLCLLFLNRYLPYARTMAGASLLAICYYGLATGWPIPLTAMLFAIGMAKGVIFPAMTSFLLQLSGTDRYGRTFSLLSISLSVGAFLGPVAAGAVRPHFSPYFLSFLALMIAVALLFPRPSFRENWRVGSPLPPVSDPS